MGPVPIVRIKHEPSAIYGGFLEINASDFDPAVHELFDEPDGNVGGSKKLSVGEIREALTVKGIAIPDGAKKAELIALLDASTPAFDPSTI